MAFRMLGLVLLTGVVGGFCGGCSDQAQPVEQPAAKAVPTNLTYEAVIAHLEATGRVIGESTETYAKMIGAEEGHRVDIDGHPFEVYVFDVETHEGQLAFKKVKNEGVFGVHPETYGNLAFFRAMKDPHPEFLTLVDSIRDMH